MRAAGTAWLMYHEIASAGRATCSRDPGYLRYVVTESEFRAHMAALSAGGFQGISAGRALDAPPDMRSSSVVISFDDGSETDLLFAAPILREFGFAAIFYVVAGFIGRPCYLSAAQLRELVTAGFEIGSHSVTHPYLADLAEADLRREIFESKERLEQITGLPIEHFSCPGGRWTPSVSRIAREAGYTSVATSRVGINSSRTDRFRLSRVAVQRGTDAAAIVRACRSEGLTVQRSRYLVLSAAKRLLGNQLYERLRAGALGRG